MLQWALVIIMYKGGATYVPQENQAQCLKNMEVIRSSLGSGEFGQYRLRCISTTKDGK